MSFQIVLPPLQLVTSEIAQTASFQIQDVHQADEMDTFLWVEKLASPRPSFPFRNAPGIVHRHDIMFTGT